MRKKSLTFLLFSLLTLPALATLNPITLLQVNFFNAYACQDYYQNLSFDENQPNSFQIWAKNFANLASYTPSTVDKSCTNNHCTWTFKYHLTASNHPTGGGCVLAGSVFWPTAQAEISAVQHDLGNSGDTSRRPASYGIICQNTTGQQPPANFYGCQLLSA